MTSGKRWVLAILVAATPCTPLFAFTARAEEPKPALSEDERTSRAQALFREAVAAFAAGRYHSAIELFTEADRIQPRPELSFDIARSYENLDDEVAAVSFYREYLRRAGHPPDEAVVQKRIEALMSRRAEPAPAWEPSDSARVVSTETPSGAYAGQGQPALEGTPRDRSTDDSSNLLTTMGWVGLGTAAAAFGGAAVFEVMRRHAESNAEGEHEQIRFDQYVHDMQADRTTARVLFGAGAVLSVAGGVMLYLGKNKSEAAKSGPRVALRVSPDALAADASWRF